MSRYYTLITDVGASLIAEAVISQSLINITHIAVGDGNGVEYDPTGQETALRREVWRGAVITVAKDARNPNWIKVEGAIPATDGGFTLREVGLYDSSGTLIAIGNYPSTYKPASGDGTTLDLVLNTIINVQNADVVNMNIDPLVAIASRQYVDDSLNARTQKVTNVEQFDYLVDGENWGVAIQKAIRDTVGEVVLNPARAYGISETIYTKNDVTIGGAGHAFGTQVYATSEFYDNPNNLFIDGKPVLFAASTTGYPQPIKRSSHFKMKNIHILSRPWSEFVHEHEQFLGRKQSIAVHGTFYEGNFEDVSCSGFQVGFDVDCNNTKFIGAAIALGNGITYNLSGAGGSIIQTSSVLGDTAVRIKEFTNAITITGFHTESSSLPFQIDQHCQNISITTPHMFNFRGEAFKIHPSSKVFITNDDITNYSFKDAPDSELGKVRHVKTHSHRGKYGFINHVPDGRMLRKDASAWTSTNGTATKEPRSMEVFNKGVLSSEYENVLVCRPTSTSFTLTNEVRATGFLDFEFYANPTQSIKLEIKDAANVVLLDTGFVQGEVNKINANSIKQQPTKICGALPAATASPLTMTITCTSAEPFVITTLCIYNGRTFAKASGSADYAATGETINGFSEYKISGSASANVQSYVATPTTSDGFSRYILAGFMKADFLKNELLMIKDVAKANYENYIRALYNGYAYTESEYTAKTYLSAVKATVNDAYVYGLGTISLFPMDRDGNFVMDAVPTFGYWELGTRIYNSTPVAGGYEGWVCVTSGYGNSAVFKGFGAIQA